ncbi:SDR family oxidoreductase [Nonomuraea sp. NPDC050786]|uniref:type I polyketide synthase n=1 Tax=Nonomuraea sp. NPDC050786 TaxID=3154840 RepID=UPI0033C1D3A2
MLEEHRHDPHRADPDLDDLIAIIGLATRVPGAHDADQYWSNLAEGREAIAFPSDDELIAAGVPAAALVDPHYVRAVAEPPDLELFDAEFFRFSPRDACVLDPQIRMFLEMSHTAIENAGYDPARIDGSVGVYGAAGAAAYVEAHTRRRYDRATPTSSMADGVLSMPDYVSAHVAYRWGFRGPAMTVSSACSSSAVAVHIACQALRTGECDVAIAGGSDLEAPVHHGYRWDAGGPFSPDGHCRPFDQAAAGTVFGSGAAAVVLKRLSDAIADRDHVWAVIRGSAVNNDGAARAGFAAPGIAGQVAVVTEAMRVAAADPADISYVEAHATGTLVGDPIEVAALAKAYRLLGTSPREIMLSSVKGNIGHLGHASGVASLVKVALCLSNERRVGTANFTAANPRLRLAETPFTVDSAAMPWPRTAGRPRVAGMSSFGIGGTNVHFVVAEGPEPARTPAPRRPQVLIWSGGSDGAVRDYEPLLADHLRRQGDSAFADTVATLQDGRTAHAVRAAVVGSAADAVKALDSGRILRGHRAHEPRPVAFLFPGQAARPTRVANGLYGVDQVFTDTVDTCLALFENVGVELRAAWQGAGDGGLSDSAHAQPLIFVVEYALAAMWRSWGIHPSMVIGHDVGELSAAAVAGVCDLPAAVRLVAAHAEATAALPHRGHTLATELAMNRFAAAFDGVTLREPVLPMISGTTGDPVHAQALDPLFWAGRLCRPVRFDVALDHLAATPDWTLLEVGAGDTLIGLAHQHPDLGAGDTFTAATLPARPAIADPDDDHRSAVTAAAMLWTQGHPVDWAAVRGHVPARRLPLPTYQYQRTRHWIDYQPEPEPTAPRAVSPASPLSRLTWVERPHPGVVKNAGGAPALVLLADDASSRPAVLALQQAGYRLTIARPGASYAETDGEFRVRPDHPGDIDLVLAAMAARGALPSLLVHGLGLAESAPTASARAADGLAESFHSFTTLIQRGMRHRSVTGVLVLTSGSVDVTGAEPIDPMKATLHGAIRTLSRESPELSCRLIDIAAPFTDEDLASEIASGSADTVVALRGPSRWERVELPYQPPMPTAHMLRRRGVYLLTGGLGGIGLAVAREMAATGLSPHLVLAGRRGLPPEGDAEADATRAAIADCERLGATVQVEACDIADLRAARRLFDTIRARHGQVNGIVHLAGVAGSGMLLVRRREDADAVLRPKVAGSLVLAEVLREHPPVDFFVVTSSRAALGGLVGSGDYAAGNAFADALCRLLGRAGVPALSINWPAWHTVGMAARSPLPVAGTVWTTEVSQDSLVVDEHRIGKRAVMPGTGFLDLVLRGFRAVAAPDESAAVALSGVTFERPMVVTCPRRVTVAFQPEGDGWAFTVHSAEVPDGLSVQHVRGSVAVLGRPIRQSPERLAALRRRLRVPAPEEANTAGLVTFGPRWDNVVRVAVDPEQDGERLVELALAEPFHDDIADFPVHPALLDNATAAATAFDPSGSYLPFCYHRCEIFRSFPNMVVSHVRHRAAPLGVIRADIDIYDTDGELLARLEGFTMRRVIADEFKGGGEFGAAPIPDGIAPVTGARLLLSLLGGRHAHHIAVRPHEAGHPVAIPDTPTAPPPPTPPPPTPPQPTPPLPTPPQLPVAMADEPRHEAGAAGADTVLKRLAVLWTAVLGVSSPADDDDFFEQGGNSLSAVELMSRVKSEFGIQLSVITMFDHPTLSAFADALVAEGAR